LAKPSRNKSSTQTAPLPSSADVLAFIREQPGKVGTREIARAFGLKNTARAELKRMLRDLQDNGAIESRRRKLHHPGALASTVFADVTGRDSDGELIAVPDEWDEEHGPAPKILIRVPRRVRPHEAAGIGDRVLLHVEEINDPTFRYSGRVIRRIDRARQRLLGVFRANPNGSGRLLPIDKKQANKELTIAADAAGGAQSGDLVAVEPLRGNRLGLSACRVVERLGSVSSEKTISLIAIHSHNIPLEFHRDTLAEAQSVRPVTMQGADAAREDWRALPLVTIDPPDAKDHDDAVHAQADPDAGNPGGHIVTVAIADVAHYVTPGSALDRDAAVRGNSVYFPDRVVPMLPERISNDLCSLRPEEDRPALAVRMIIDAGGHKRSHTFHRVMMRSAARLAYAQVQAAIDGRSDGTTGPLLDPVLKPLYAAYAALTRARATRAPLDLDLPERKLILKPDGTLDRVIQAERLDANRLIEEFMILANVAAAETLERARVPLVYRVHDEPAIEKLNALREFLSTLDISLSKGGGLRPDGFNKILARVRGRDSEQLVNEMVLRSQAQAEYSAQNYGHFGLNLRRYAHFTSPIRRYADLIVHRGLIRALRLGHSHGGAHDGLPDSVDEAALAEIAARISAAERRAMVAERETTDRLIAHFLADRIGATFEGRISGVIAAGLFVRLSETGADGFIPARTIGNEYVRYDERAQALIGSRSGERYRLGDPVTVKLVEAAPVAGALRFELLSAGRHPVSLRQRRDRPDGHPGAKRGEPRSHLEKKQKTRRQKQRSPTSNKKSKQSSTRHKQ
jgi:ribonuclease R